MIADTAAKFNWDPKVPFDQFDVRSLSNARNATESQVYRKQFLASIRDRLGTATVKGQALDLVQELFSRMVRALTKKTLCFKICGRCPNSFRICASGSTRRWRVGFGGSPNELFGIRNEFSMRAMCAEWAGSVGVARYSFGGWDDHPPRHVRVSTAMVNIRRMNLETMQPMDDARIDRKIVDLSTNCERKAGSESYRVRQIHFQPRNIS